MVPQCTSGAAGNLEGGDEARNFLPHDFFLNEMWPPPDARPHTADAHEAAVSAPDALGFS
jgi:hypothetical protein